MGDFHPLSPPKSQKFLEIRGFADRIIVPAESTATVPLAAAALGTTEGEIAKTLSFIVDEKPVLVLMEGNAGEDDSAVGGGGARGSRAGRCLPFRN